MIANLCARSGSVANLCARSGSVPCDNPLLPAEYLRKGTRDQFGESVRSVQSLAPHEGVAKGGDSRLVLVRRRYTDVSRGRSLRYTRLFNHSMPPTYMTTIRTMLGHLHPEGRASRLHIKRAVRVGLPEVAAMQMPH